MDEKDWEVLHRIWPNKEIKQYKHYYHGNGTLTIECPFCSKIFLGYSFSMGGHGKKCPRCGAMHYYKSQDFIALKDKSNE